MKKGHPHVFTLILWMPYRSALEWTRTTTPLGTGPQPAAYTIPPRGLTLIISTCILHLSWRFVNGLKGPFLQHFATNEKTVWRRYRQTVFSFVAKCCKYVYLKM